MDARSNESPISRPIPGQYRTHETCGTSMFMERSQGLTLRSLTFQAYNISFEITFMLLKPLDMTSTSPLWTLSNELLSEST